MSDSLEEQEKYYGKIVGLVNSDSPNLSCAYEIEEVLLIDEYFAAEKNIVVELIELLRRLPVTNKSEAWLATLLEVNEKGEKNHWSLQTVTRSSGNPLGGKLDTYPLAAFILQAAEPSIYEQSIGIKVLFLFCLIHSNKTHQLDTVSAILRRAISPKSKRIHLIKSFPSFISFKESIKDFKKLLSNQKFKAAIKDDKEFSDALKKITDFQLPDRATLKKPFKPAVVELPKLSSGGYELNWTVSASEFFDPVNPNEPHRVPFALIEISNDEEADELRDLDPKSLDEEIELNLNESRYWLNRVEKLVPNDYGRLTKIERLTLVKFIKENLASNCKSGTSAAGLIGLMYVTGSNLEDLWEAKIGPDGDFQENGNYRRFIRLPQNSFRPNSQQQKYFQSVADQVQLDLPEPLKTWLKQRIHDDPNDSASFEQLLKLNLEEAKSLVYSALGDLRKQSRLFRLRSERLPTALALESTLMFRDPLITHLIAGRKTQSPPMLSYYAVHSIKNLVGYYKQVTRSLLEIKC